MDKTKLHHLAAYLHEKKDGQNYVSILIYGQW